MKAREYQIICLAVEAGVARGFQRAYKHRDEPEPDQLVQAVVSQKVIDAICEYFILDQDMERVDDGSIRQ